VYVDEFIDTKKTDQKFPDNIVDNDIESIEENEHYLVDDSFDNNLHISFKHSLECDKPFQDIEIFSNDQKTEEIINPNIEELLKLSNKEKIEFDNNDIEDLTFEELIKNEKVKHSVRKQNKHYSSYNKNFKKPGIEQLKKNIIKSFDRYDFEKILKFDGYVINIYGQIKKFDRNKLTNISYDKSNDSYAIVCLFRKGCKIKCSVPDIVIETFIPHLVGKNYKFFYIDKNKNNNFLGNLRII